MFRLINTLLLLLLLNPMSQAGTTLKIATLAPDGTNWMKEMRAAAKQIKRQTDGRVKIRFYPGGVMGNDSSVLRKIRIGQLHGGAITGGGLSSIYKDAQVYTLPFQFRNLQEVDAVRQVMDPQIIEGIKKQGYISFGLSEGGFAYLLSNSPVTSTENMKDLKIWIPEGDQVNASMFQELGISPVPLPLTDVLTGLQTGLIDTVASAPVGAIALQWHTRVSYLTQVPLAYLYATLVLKENAFNKLRQSDQSIVKQTLESAFDRIDRQNRTDNEQAMIALKRQGVEFISPSTVQQQAWEAHAGKTLRKLSKESIFSEQMLNRMQSLIQQYRQIALTR
ncbi:MAG: TRAP transporter substrate-binding protein DctP [Candidatus Thiodiazotropha sp. (ex Lucina aurantia)]|nr:TRAP transporter substrate-binding protein DctP [Candidatus Thiodiazotropha sp. (ex Lucina pensylvanica)]MBT3016916.1 TRAP transporter substrate-binding protein DctP [Candidatus Thiodiazotropha taylori]MBT3043929.1 TRAP transporter substrate-binding protein DctP [Candidatus Thiodiazotropha sp. (ex Codakia orbicularis)]MBV2104868.1 TRAP transporter substrate-binding protein DctP [Candidatus Thiodiazotropha sp. (ex Lucina aurantia)]MBT3025103.1 TRAP transporter substrate-binding protein DctP [